MDITLERILSLIPKKPNGDFVHGEKKKFATSIGFKSGEIVSDWIMGRSTSYKNYLYEISARYNVSVEWLRGERSDAEETLMKAIHATAERKKPADQMAGGLMSTKYLQLNAENRAVIDSLIEKLLKSQSDE